jgi:site-specific recombinase XerD
MDNTVQHLQKYLLTFHNGASLSADVPLFYSVSRGAMHPLTDRRIRYLLKEYGEKARIVCSEVPENVHPHLFRHSLAMHLYQAGMDLTFVSQWLGHAQLSSTLMYAHADTEHKRIAIAAATTPDNPLYSKLNSARYTVTDEETLKRLTGLR